MPVRVKICGLTRAADAAGAAAAGADYLGVVFADGPRRITAAAAGEIRAAAAGVPVFGVFGDQPVAEILRIARSAGLVGAQLHGAYTETDAARLRAEHVMVWRVLRLAAAPDLDLVSATARHADAVLVEPRVAHAAGGSGTALDRTLAIGARARLHGIVMVLAGGLTPDTVGEAVALVRPDVVDVSSGVECLPGRKDPHKITRFLEAVIGPSAIS